MPLGLMAVIIVGVTVGVVALISSLTRASRAQWLRLAERLEGELDRLPGIPPRRIVRASVGGHPVEIRERMGGRHDPGGVEVCVRAPYGCTLQFWRKGTTMLFQRLQKVDAGWPLDQHTDVYTDDPARAALLLGEADQRERVVRLLRHGSLLVRPEQAELSCTNYRRGPAGRGARGLGHGKVLNDLDTLLALVDELVGLAIADGREAARAAAG